MRLLRIILANGNKAMGFGNMDIWKDKKVESWSRKPLMTLKS